VTVISRTAIVQTGSEEERQRYFERELVRSNYIYHSIGYVDDQGYTLRTDGTKAYFGGESFIREALLGKVVITDPQELAFSPERQIYIVAPVYGDESRIEGVVYATILFSMLERLITFADETSPFLMYNDDGSLIHCSETEELMEGSLFNPASRLYPLVGELLSGNNGVLAAQLDGVKHSVFYTKVSGTPWRFALEVPLSKLEEPVKPLFWRIFTSIVISELIIVVFFFLYFERIIQRLVNILGVTEQAAAGRFEEAKHLEIEPHDEIGQLAHSVNGMMEHLQDMFDRLEAIINQNQYAFIVLDANYKVTYLNRTAEQMLGYKTEELAGKATPLAFMDMDEIRAEAVKLSIRLRRHVPPGLEVFRELRRESFSYEREWTFIHKDGTRIPTLHSSNGLRDRNGRFSGVVGMVLDISDRKQMEKTRNRLLEIVESAKDLIASVDADGKVIYMNKAGKELLGLPKWSDSASLEQHVNPDMYAELVKGSQLAQEFGFWESSAQLLRNDGTQVHVSMVVVAHRNERTGELFFSCIARDISEQKMVQEELVRATLEAEEASKAKGSFLALMSHEIRTPLNGIIGLVQLMRKTGLSASQMDYMDKMNTSSETLLRIINDILDFSKIEAGKVDIERLPFQPEDLLHRLADQLSVFLGGKEQFEFMLVTPEHLPHTIIGDALRLEQVLLNLCMNAIKFTNRGRVKLELQLVHEDEQSVQIRFLIADTGIGMTPQQVERLFKPFTQADGSTTRKFGGTGLGLVIAKTFVELMGGKLAVESEARVGSEFYFTLPFAVTHKYSEQKRQVSSELRELPIWIVEDAAEMREHWSCIVEDYGLTPILFSSWKEANRRLSRIGEGARPGLILLDMEMPDMYGVETWLEFHREAEATGVKTIAMTTSYGRDEMLQLPSDQRPFTLLIKPVMRTGLLQAIENALGQKSMYVEERLSAAPTLPDPAALRLNSRILLAEDNRINQLVAMEILKEQGYRVGLAENGQEVLDKLEQEQWDLILMDIHMPVMDGSEAVRIIRSQPKYDEIPIIAVTANVLRGDHDRYLKQGMNDVVTKPIAADRLHKVISYWLKQGCKLLGRAEGLTSQQAPGGPTAESGNDSGLPETSGMDIGSALARVNGKRKILIHMMEQFLLDYDSFNLKLRPAIARSELDNARRMVHTLKGAAGYLSADNVLEAVYELEDILRSWEGNEPRIAEALDRLDYAMQELLGGIRRSLAVFDKNA
jgi:two-component system sensor histidine kinase/response regulator